MARILWLRKAAISTRINSMLYLIFASSSSFLDMDRLFIMRQSGFRLYARQVSSQILAKVKAEMESEMNLTDRATTGEIGEAVGRGQDRREWETRTLPPVSRVQIMTDQQAEILSNKLMQTPSIKIGEVATQDS